MEDHIYSCFIGYEKYCFYYDNPKLDSNRFNGVATFWNDSMPTERYTIPFWENADEIDLTHDKIKEEIGKYLHNNKSDF